MINYWKTSDIKISTDSGGYMSAEHKWAGVLIDGDIFNSRSQCRREAVLVLKEMKELENYQTNKGE